MKHLTAAERFRWLNRVNTTIDAIRIISLLVFVYSLGLACGVVVAILALRHH